MIIDRVVYKSTEALEQGFEHIKNAPSDHGKLELIVARPEEDQRLEMEEGRLDEEKGLLGDNWYSRGSSRTKDGSAHPEMQINMMNSRVIDLITENKQQWKLAGDQLYVDFNLHKDNVPPGTQLSIGEAILEVTPEPHTGCKKFSQRFGVEALKFISTKEGRQWQMRGINARVVKSGSIKTGDTIRKI